MRNREKIGREGFLKPSPDPRNPRSGGGRLAKTPTTAWDMLKWAYGREQVRFTGWSNVGFAYSGDHHSISATAAALTALVLGARIKGNAAGFGDCACHGDALVVDMAVREVCDREPTKDARSSAYWLIVKSAEAAELPEWEPEMPPPRLVPVRRPNGKPKTFCPYPKRHDVVACMVSQVGVSESERAEIYQKARDRYGRFRALAGSITLELMTRETSLTRWRAEAIGVAARPWE